MKKFKKKITLTKEWVDEEIKKLQDMQESYLDVQEYGMVSIITGRLTELVMIAQMFEKE